MADDPVVDAIANARRRMVGSILGYAERELYPHLAEIQQQAFRKKVLESTGAFSDFALDVLRAYRQPGAWFGEDALRLLEEISEQVRSERG